jgi:hypothetical protein
VATDDVGLGIAEPLVSAFVQRSPVEDLKIRLGQIFNFHNSLLRTPREAT